jgi:hypothetical protein
MSWVTGIILVFSLGEDVLDTPDGDEWPILGEINKWLREHYDEEMHDLTEPASGGKGFPAVLTAGSFNFFDEDKFIALIQGLEWLEPENVQLFLKTENDEAFAPVKLQLLAPKKPDFDEEP